MAKTESTAVNQLIQLVQTATPLKPDPTEDLMFKKPSSSAAKKVSPPRTAQTTIPLRGASEKGPTVGSALLTPNAGEVSPLPRQRAPQGTQRGVPAINGDKPPANPSVRMSTAPSSMSIPAIQPWASAEGSEADVLPEDDRLTPQKLDARQTRPSLPPPTRQTLVGQGRPTAPPVRPSAPPAPPAPRTTNVQHTEAPSTTPVAAPFGEAPHGYPSAAPYLPHLAPDMTSHQAWFDQSQPVEIEIEVEQQVGTSPVRKTTDWKKLIPKLIAPTIGFVIIGALVGGYLASERGRDTPDVAREAPAVVPDRSKNDEPKAVVDEPAKVAVDEPKADEPAKVAVVDEPKAKADEPKAVEAEVEPKAVEPKVVEAPKPAQQIVAPAVPGRTALVDIRIDSAPQGATVTLVDRGKTSFLGTTPIRTSVDPSRKYDLVFTYADKPTHIEQIDPSTTKSVAVTLGKKTADAPKAVVKKEAPKVEVKKEPPPAKATKAVAVKKDAPKTEAPKVEKKEPMKVEDPFKDKPATKQPVETKAPALTVAGDGVLMISSKPPCDIYVNGAPTGLTTPQRALKLPVGKHKITLVNEAEKIRKTIPVTITADQPTKLIENFMK